MRARLLVPLALAAALTATLLPAHAQRPGRDLLRDEQWALDLVRAPRAWTVSTGRGVVVAVVGSGIDRLHPDLRGALGRGTNLVDPSADTRDRSSAGTVIAGIVGARRDNGEGIAGVAPDVRLLPVKVTDSGSTMYGETGPLSSPAHSVPVAEGIRWAADHGADVIVTDTPSLYGEALNTAFSPVLGPDRAVALAVAHAARRGALVVLPAGDGTLPLCGPGGESPQALCVGAVDRERRLAWYSRFDVQQGARFLVAPGGLGATTLATPFAEIVVQPPTREDDVVATTSLEDTLHSEIEPGYAHWAGTAVAAAHVAGVAALLYQKGLSRSAVLARLLSTTTDLGDPGRDPVFGHGLLDAARAVGAR